jgi:hypothetical protein
MTTPLPASDVLALLRMALGASQKADDAIAIPTLLVPGQWLGGKISRKDSRIEDAVVYWFRENGFFAERSYKGGQRGYAEVFRVLEYWRPWDPDSIRQDYRDSIADQQAGVASILNLTDEQRQAMSFSERFAVATIGFGLLGGSGSSAASSTRAVHRPAGLRSRLLDRSGGRPPAASLGRHRPDRRSTDPLAG